MPDIVNELTEGTVKGNVEKLLERNPDSRNSDKYLIYLYVHEVLGVPITYEQWQKISGVSFESIRRVRQKIQEEGRYLPTDPEVARKRGRNQEEIRNYYAGDDWK